MRSINVYICIVLLTSLYGTASIPMQICRGDGHASNIVRTFGVEHEEEFPEILKNIKTIVAADDQSIAVSLLDVKHLYTQVEL